MSSATSDEDRPPRKKAKHHVERDAAKRDLATLPHDILLKIFRYLDLKSINRCATMCSTFYNISKDSSLYRNVTLGYQMTPAVLEAYTSKISCPVELTIDYKFNYDHEEIEDYTEFNKYISLILRKCGEYLKYLKIESCKNNEILELLSECPNLKELTLHRCKALFTSLTSLKGLQKINFLCCHFPAKLVPELIKNNGNLERIELHDNVNVNGNEICEVMSAYNLDVKEVYISQSKKWKAKSLRTLARLNKLKILLLIGGRNGFNCDPEDAIEQIAAGCQQLKKLTIYGWSELNDDNIMPLFHNCIFLKELDLRGIGITIKSCREAALSLPNLKSLDVVKNQRVKKSQLVQLQKEFKDIDIPVY